MCFSPNQLGTLGTNSEVPLYTGVLAVPNSVPNVPKS
jgi:hypothetical protein